MRMSTRWALEISIRWLINSGKKEPLERSINAEQESEL